MGSAGGLEVAVKDGGIEVQAVGPCHRAAFWINLDLREVQRIVKGSEDCSLIRSGQELKFSGDAVVEREPHYVVSRHLDGLDMRDLVGGLHGSGSIEPRSLIGFRPLPGCRYLDFVKPVPVSHQT
jgi:hypothetical protein